MLIKNIKKSGLLGILILCLIVAVAGCGKGSEKKNVDSDSIAAAEFHADHDIAMTAKSVVDAIKVGERIFSEDYTYNGVLTDGVGKPLFTSAEGLPGKWEVTVLGPKTVQIQNAESGDLVPTELRDYMLKSFNLNEENRIDKADASGQSKAEIYDMQGSYMIVETFTTTAGSEYQNIRITLTGDRPENK